MTIDINQLRAELEASRLEHERQMNRWPLRWFGPESPILLRTLFGLAVLCYIAGFVVDASFFAAAIGCVIMCWPMWEDRQKYLSEQRRRAWRAHWDEMERLMRNYAALPGRMRAIYGPIADCNGMGV